MLSNAYTAICWFLVWQAEWLIFSHHFVEQCYVSLPTFIIRFTVILLESDKTNANPTCDFNIPFYYILHKNNLYHITLYCITSNCITWLNSALCLFQALREVELEQPIFGANYIKGKVIAQPNGNWEGEAKFKLHFKSGGAIDFGTAMLKAAQMGIDWSSFKKKWVLLLTRAEWDSTTT